MTRIPITYPIAMAAGRDAADRAARKAGRTAWSADDYAVGAAVTRKLLGLEE